MKKVKILGFYRRERDKAEYVHYLADGEEHLTNGVCDWTQGVNAKLESLCKTDKIDLPEMEMRLKKFYPHGNITNILQET